MAISPVMSITRVYRRVNGNIACNVDHTCVQARFEGYLKHTSQALMMLGQWILFAGHSTRVDVRHPVSLWNNITLAVDPTLRWTFEGSSECLWHHNGQCSCGPSEHWNQLCILPQSVWQKFWTSWLKYWKHISATIWRRHAEYCWTSLFARNSK